MPPIHPAARTLPHPGPRATPLAASRADRLDLVARVLADRPGVTAADLAAELGVSVRSVFRDLGALRARGYPVEAARGRGGGLRLHPNWGLGRVLLTRDEALGTLLGLAVAERIGLPMFAAELGRARRRLAGAFPAGERRRLAPLRERVFVGGPASAAVRAAYGQLAAAATRRLQVAFVEERVVRATYVADDGRRSDRELEPHALLITPPAWYLLAYDRLRAAPRAFRLDRLVAVEAEADSFRPRARELAETLLGATGLDPDPL
jgi:predicted DNA-binding transcriptional regulator YafY